MEPEATHPERVIVYTPEKLLSTPNLDARIRRLTQGEQDLLEQGASDEVTITDTGEWFFFEHVFKNETTMGLLQPPAPLELTWRLIAHESIHSTIFTPTQRKTPANPERKLDILLNLYRLQTGENMDVSALSQKYTVTPQRINQIAVRILHKFRSIVLQDNRLYRQLMPYDPGSFAAELGVEWIHLMLSSSLDELPNGQDIGKISVRNVGELTQLYSKFHSIQVSNAPTRILSAIDGTGRTVHTTSSYNSRDLPDRLGIQTMLTDLTVSQLLAIDPSFLAATLAPDEYEQLKRGIIDFLTRTKGVINDIEKRTLAKP